MMPRRHLADQPVFGAMVPYSKWLLNTYCTLFLVVQEKEGSLGAYAVTHEQVVVESYGSE